MSISKAVTIGVFVLSCVACGHSTKEPNVASTTQKQAPGSAVVGATPNLGVSSDLIAQCKLQFGGTAAEHAPRFDFDRAELSSDDRSVLERVATCVTTGPLKGRSLRLVGHTDPRGEPEYNMSLGDKRASVAKDYLAHLGVPNNHLGETSRGELDANGHDDPGFSRDRRVDIMLQ